MHWSSKRNEKKSEPSSSSSSSSSPSSSSPSSSSISSFFSPTKRSEPPHKIDDNKTSRRSNDQSNFPSTNSSFPSPSRSNLSLTNSSKNSSSSSSSSSKGLKWKGYMLSGSSSSPVLFATGRRPRKYAADASLPQSFEAFRPSFIKRSPKLSQECSTPSELHQKKPVHSLSSSFDTRYSPFRTHPSSSSSSLSSSSSHSFSPITNYSKSDMIPAVKERRGSPWSHLKRNRRSFFRQSDECDALPVSQDVTPSTLHSQDLAARRNSIGSVHRSTRWPQEQYSEADVPNNTSDRRLSDPSMLKSSPMNINDSFVPPYHNTSNQINPASSFSDVHQPYYQNQNQDQNQILHQDQHQNHGYDNTDSCRYFRMINSHRRESSNNNPNENTTPTLPSIRDMDSHEWRSPSININTRDSISPRSVSSSPPIVYGRSSPLLSSPSPLPNNEQSHINRSPSTEYRFYSPQNRSLYPLESSPSNPFPLNNYSSSLSSTSSSHLPSHQYQQSEQMKNRDRSNKSKTDSNPQRKKEPRKSSIYGLLN